MANPQLIAGLLKINGIVNLLKIEIHDSISGGLSGLNKLITLYFTDDSEPQKYLVKGNEGDEWALSSNRWREAWIYEKVLKDNTRMQGVNTPETILNLIDPSNG